jgi:iron complex transport system ATP-binding protein
MELSESLYGPRPAALKVEALSWGPTRRQTIIHDLAFSVNPGEMLAIVGPNGAGKSSLLRCLYRFHRPVAGRVSLDGIDLWQLEPRDVARRVATVLQEPAGDFGLTVAEVVELGLTPHAESRNRKAATAAVGEALSLMNLTHLAARSFASLSGGEKQRTMIAKALVQKPDLLILDEPTNHLDIRHQLEVLALLAHLPTTVIVSLHDLPLAAAHADHVLVMHDGRKVACGPALKVLTPETIRETFAVETTVERHPKTGRPRFSFHLDHSL